MVSFGFYGPKGRTAVLDEMYRDLQGPRVFCSQSTAEMIKYTSNTLLATMISFTNEIAELCEGLEEVDIVDVMEGVHLSRYLTSQDNGGRTAEIAAYLHPGVGYGGSCLPKDTAALTSHASSLGVPMPLLEQVQRTNLRQPQRVVRRALEMIKGHERRRVAVLGLAFKPDTDDIRESPALTIIEGLITEGVEVVVHDPMVNSQAAAVLPDEGVSFVESLADAVDACDAMILVTSWRDYQRLPELLAGIDDPPLLIDGRRMIDKDSVLSYWGVGL